MSSSLRKLKPKSRKGAIMMISGAAVSVLGGVALWRGAVRQQKCWEEYLLQPYMPVMTPCEFDPVKVAGALIAPVGVVLFMVGVGVGLVEAA